jgi:hypothetical protein
LFFPGKSSIAEKTTERKRLTGFFGSWYAAYNLDKPGLQV